MGGTDYATQKIINLSKFMVPEELVIGISSSGIRDFGLRRGCIASYHQMCEFEDT